MADPQSREGTRYTEVEILKFCERLHAASDLALEAAFDAADGQEVPAIMVSPSEGRLLYLLMRMAQVRRVVEVGTLAGFSAIHIARALPANGHLWTLESNARHVELARAHLDRAGLGDRVTVVLGDAQASLLTLETEGPFDAVFLDADKGSYDEYGAWALRNLRPGGLLLADNAYYFGKLLDPVDPSAAAVRRLHELVAKHFDSTCVPTPDGLLLGVRRAEG